MNRLSIARAHSRAAVRVLIAAAVLAGCVLADCAVLAYELGRQTGAAVHARNDQLAALARRLATGERPPAPVPVAPQTAPTPVPVPTPPPVVAIAPAPRNAPVAAPTHRPHPSRLTVKQLRELTGAKSKRLRKADLVAMAMAMQGVAA